MSELAEIRELQQRIALYEDLRAYQQLYELLFERLFKFSCSIVKSREAAEEIVSDTFIKVWQMRNELGKIDALKIYLYTITKNFSLNYLARHYKFPTVNLEDIDVEVFVCLLNPEERLISAETNERIRQAINSLPSQCRLIFQLVKEDGLRYKEVAAVLSLSVHTVRNQIALATKKIADALPAHLHRMQPVARFSSS